MASEIELKLVCLGEVTMKEVSESLASLNTTWEESVGISSQLTNTYYDSIELDLRKRRIALRIRQDGARFIQTLKTAGAGVDGIHSRGEWEWGLASNDLNKAVLDSLSSEVWGAELARLDLIPIFKTDFVRESRRFIFKELRFEVVLDKGRISVERSSQFELINEIEVEFIGPANNVGLGVQVTQSVILDALEEIASVLVRALSVARSDESKAQKGYKLFASTNP